VRALPGIPPLWAGGPGQRADRVSSSGNTPEGPTGVRTDRRMNLLGIGQVPIEKVFAKTLINKFPWALDVDPAYRFQRALPWGLPGCGGGHPWGGGSSPPNLESGTHGGGPWGRPRH